MTLQELFPYRVCVNLGFREDRRRRVWKRFDAMGLEVDRQAGIRSSLVRDSWGFLGPSRYACSLAKRLAVRRAKLAGAPAVLLMEDDVVFAEDIGAKLAAIELPDDWEVFYLGCKHLERPEPVGPGLVRVTRAADHHAIGIRVEVYDEVIRGLAGTGRGREPTIRYSDVKLAEVLATKRTVYAAYPNLAWQEYSLSENAGKVQSFYDRKGRQITERHAVDGLDDEMPRFGVGEVQVERCSGRPSDELALELKKPVVEEQLVRRDAGGKPQVVIDREPPSMEFLRSVPQQFRLEDLFPVRLYINLARREERRHEIEWQFDCMGLSVERLPAADGRLARNTRGHGSAGQYGCRLSHRMALRMARQRKAPAVLIFEDDAVFHPEFRELVERLPPPDDWGMLIFGCTHVETPDVVAPGWVRAKSFWGTHAYAVRQCWYRTFLRALNEKGKEGDGPKGLGTDLIYSRLGEMVPVYATLPNLSWQDEGYSDLMGSVRKPFGDDGRQLRKLEEVGVAYAEMKRWVGDSALGPSLASFPL